MHCGFDLPQAMINSDVQLCDSFDRKKTERLPVDPRDIYRLGSGTCWYPHQLVVKQSLINLVSSFFSVELERGHALCVLGQEISTEHCGSPVRMKTKKWQVGRDSAVVTAGIMGEF